MAGLSADALAAHDLVWLAVPPGGWKQVVHAPDGQDWPAWISPAMLERQPLVVRRDGCRRDAVPVGVRGVTRAQRFGAWASPDAIRSVVTPAEIARQRAWRVRPGLMRLVVFQALDVAADELDGAGIRWGVTGSAGYALASDTPSAVHHESDLDLLVVAHEPLPPDHRTALEEILRTAPVRIDIQVATPHGGFALREFLRNGGRVLLKTGHGPRMCADPWWPAP